MKAISDELIRITTLLGVSYERAASLNQANTLIHYQDISSIIVIYVGFGSATIDRTGSAPFQTVETTVYVLDRKLVVDELAVNVGTILAATEQVAADIIYQFNTSPDLIDYTLEPVEVFDDMLVGYLLTFSPAIDAPVCTVIP